jgi:hypothetical protein
MRWCSRRPTASVPTPTQIRGHDTGHEEGAAIASDNPTMSAAAPTTAIQVKRRSALMASENGLVGTKSSCQPQRGVGIIVTLVQTLQTVAIDGADRRRRSRSPATRSSNLRQMRTVARSPRNYALARSLSVFVKPSLITASDWPLVTSRHPAGWAATSMKLPPA